MLDQKIMMLLLLLAPLVLCLVKSGLSQTYPSSVFVPNNCMTDVSLSCSGNQLEWRVNGTAFNVGYPPAGINVIVITGHKTLQTLIILSSSVLSYNGTSFQCRQHGENFNSVPVAFIIVYGKSAMFEECINAKTLCI